MRITSAKVRNFASYKELAFDFTQAGLALIQGPTGSGKSTLCDIVPWICFGTTAKGGKVDEILSWPGDQIVTGVLRVEVQGKQYLICRARGPKAKDNDLFFHVSDDGFLDAQPARGKDIPDTQRLINELLGMDADLYLAGAYFHEFSQTAQFFTTTAKHRRSICEQIVDLSLATSLQQKLSDEAKVAKAKHGSLQRNKENAEGALTSLEMFLMRERVSYTGWATKQASQRAELVKLNETFEEDQRQALITYQAAEEAYLKKEQASPVCSECGQLVAGKKHVRHNPFTAKIDAVLSRENTYLEQLARLNQETNPHGPRVTELKQECEQHLKRIADLSAEAETTAVALADLEILQEVTAAYRSVVISNTIDYIETQTNQLLTDHFDAEIRVTFQVEDADKLDVGITKDGNVCSYTQLSKGQRQLLKLCFGVAIMRAVSNHHGIKFHQLWFDEVFQGLDSEMMVKAYGLLQTIAQDYESTYVVEHATELKERFLTKYSVELINGASQIEKA